MKIINIIILIGLIVWLFSCNSADNSYQVASPDGKIVVKFEVVQKQAYYSVLKNKNHLILPSKLGLRFQEMKPLGDHVEVISIQEKSFNETWEQAWGERRLIENKYDELTIKLRETNGKGRNFYIIFRAFNDGIGFRYHIPEQGNISEFKKRAAL